MGPDESGQPGQPPQGETPNPSSDAGAQPGEATPSTPDASNSSTDASATEPSSGPDAAVDAGSPDGSSAPDQPGIEDDCPGHDRVDFSMVGWATQAGGTTGGRGGTTVTVRDGASLVAALEAKRDDPRPLTILIAGTITPQNSGVEKIDVKDVRDVSILGAGMGAELDGIGLKIVRAGNIVVRNLRIHHVASGDKDGISIEGPADHIWIDHNEIYNQYQGVDKDFYDGLIDAKAEAEYITYSWNYLHDSWKTALVGSSESDTFDRKLTMHHNRIENCNSRVPLFRGGNGHIFNNHYADIADTGINSRIGACLRIENNSFERAQNPWVSAYSDELGGGELRCNLTLDISFAYASDVHELPTCRATVPYAYANVLNHPSRVAGIVREHSGVGKLSDPTDF